ncbi:zinc finger protein [Schistosoma japonicum]|nr:zinc finger protein [Schistosoma japonicum]
MLNFFLQTSGTLWRHKKTHEKRVYHLCPICSTSFTRLSNLNRHLLRTHKQKHHRYQQQTNNTDSEILINSSNKKISTHQRTTTTTTTLNVNSKNKLSRSRQKCKNVSIDHGTNGLNQHDISSCQQQTVEQPHLSTTGLSSDHHTVINIIADQDLRYSNIINISDNNLNKSVLINSSVSCADTSSSASSASSNIQSTTLSTQSHITVATTEAPIISTNLSGYQTVNLTDNSTVFMLNFSDLETNGHAYFEQADLLNDRHDNLQHNMLISVSDPIYHQATEFSNSLVVSTSSESSVGTLATSSSCSSSPPSGVPGSAITLQSNLLLPIQLTTNTFSPITSSSIIGSNGSVSCDGITNSSNNNPWSTTISFQPEPSLCYLITATEPIESDVLCDQINGQRNMITSTDNNSTNITSQTSNDLSLNPNIGSVNDADDDDDERNDVGGGSIIGDTSHSISSVDILNSLQSDVVDNMMNGAVLEIGCQSPQLTRNCIFYETCCSSALTSSHSPSVSMPISSCANSSTMSYPSVSQSVSIWRPVDSVDCGTSLLNKQQDQFFQIPVNSNCLTVDDNSNNHNSTSLPFTGVAADGYQVDHYGQRYHHIHNLFPLLSKSHDGFSEGDRNDIDDDDDGEEDSYYGGVAADNSVVTNNNRKDHRISTNLLDTSIMLSWNPSNDCNIINSNNNRPVELYNYSHCSPKFPSPDPNNLSPSPIHLDHQHQQSFELLSFQQSGHDHQQITSNLVPGFIGVSSSETFLSSSSTLSTTSSRSISSSTLYENHLVNDCTNFLGQFYHHHHNTASVSNMNLPYKNNYNIPNIINNK